MSPTRSDGGRCAEIDIKLYRKYFLVCVIRMCGRVITLEVFTVHTKDLIHYIWKCLLYLLCHRRTSIENEVHTKDLIHR